jgi:uncharacterized protein (TIGR01244 family)
MRYLTLVFAILTFSIVLASTSDPIPNLQQPRYDMFTAGQPTEAGWKIISDTGIKTVINVLPEQECLKNEKGAVLANGMSYHHFPFDPNEFSRETFVTFGKLMQRVETPVLVHCSTGNHVGGLWFGYRVLVEKASLASALREARMIGMTRELEDRLFPWLAQQTQL